MYFKFVIEKVNLYVPESCILKSAWWQAILSAFLCCLRMSRLTVSMKDRQPLAMTTCQWSEALHKRPTPISKHCLKLDNEGDVHWVTKL